MDEILHHLRNYGKPLFVGIYRGDIIPGFLRWCRISSIHSRVLRQPAGNPETCLSGEKRVDFRTKEPMYLYGLQASSQPTEKPGELWVTTGSTGKRGSTSDYADWHEVNSHSFFCITNPVLPVATIRGIQGQTAFKTWGSLWLPILTQPVDTLYTCFLGGFPFSVVVTQRRIVPLCPSISEFRSHGYL